MNIFQKDCPECAAANRVDAVSCGCGYCFDPEALARTDPQEYAHQQDRLYRDYLAARIAQAEAECIVAREQAKADPENTYKASGALLAEQTVNALQAEMKRLSLRIPASKPRTAPPVAAPVPVVTPPAVITKPVAAPTHAKAIVGENQKPQAAPKATAGSNGATGPNRPPAAAPKLELTSGGATTRRSAAKAPSAPTVFAKAQPAIPRPSITAEPDEAFKRLQAERAEAVAHAKARSAMKTAKPAVKKSPGTQRAASPPAVPASPLLVAKAAPMQDCPNCTATVPADRKRCSCGYTFSRAAQEVPAIALDAGALAILTEGISRKSTTRRR